MLIKTKFKQVLFKNYRYLATKKMEIQIVPMLEDNYAYLLYDDKNNQVSVVDPVEPEKVINAINKKYPNSKLVSILTTHHHWDHSGGNKELFEKFPDIKVYGFDDRVPKVNHIVKDKDTFQLGSYTITCLHTPCHTTGHICYYIEKTKLGDQEVTPAVFTGDTLFIGGCGRFFEGNAQDMKTSLDKLKGLPKETKVYCGHEYTNSNYKFAIKMEPNNSALKKNVEWAKTINCTIPSTIENELNTNPFMRTDVKELQTQHGYENDSVGLMAFFRNSKDNFKA